MEENGPEVVGELIADEIETLDNLSVAQLGAEEALKVAINAYSNRRSLLQRDVNKTWRQIGMRLGIEDARGLKTEKVNGTAKVIRMTPEEEEERMRSWMVGPL